MEAFRAGWAEAGAQAFLDRFAAVMTPDVVLVQPLMGATHGLDAFRREFLGLRYLIPDLRGEVHGWAPSAEDPRVLFIELSLRGTLGGSPIGWRLVDRVTLDEDGRCCERVAFFDPSPLVLGVLLRPGAWLRWWRSGVGWPRRRARIPRAHLERLG